MSDSITKYNEMLESGGWISNSTGKETVDPIVEDVISKMRLRSKVGIAKYGTTLYDSPDGFYAFLNHLQEELTDAILYIEKIKQQK
jgi:hypothetical protein